MGAEWPGLPQDGAEKAILLVPTPNSGREYQTLLAYRKRKQSSS
jgi:hypothetical protein